MNNTLLRNQSVPKWLGKQVLFTLVVFGFAIWPLSTPRSSTPQRLQAADFLKLQYLKESLARAFLKRSASKTRPKSL